MKVFEKAPVEAPGPVADTRHGSRARRCGPVWWAVRLASGTLAVATLFVHSAGAAEPLSLSLAWTAPLGCPTREDVLSEVRRLLGGSTAPANPLTASAGIERAGPSDYRLRLALDEGSGERSREVRAPACAELGDAAALILALAIDPAAVALAPAKSPTEGDPEAPPPPPPPAPLPPLLPLSLSVEPPWVGPRDATPNVPAPPVPSLASTPVFALPVFHLPAPPAPRPAPPPSVVRAHALLAAEAGTFRDLSPMLRTGVSVAPEPLRIEIALVGAWGGKISAPASAEKGGEMWLGGGALTACREIPLGGASRALVAACAGVEGGVILASSYGVTEPGTGVAPWVAPLAGGLFRWPFARGVALRLDLLVEVPLVHPTFRIGGLGVVHEVGYVAARAGGGVEIDLTSQ